ncbi:cupin domain-containing protein [Catenuloplanes atrovinosus]|uniref:Quercetin dioxygenase-like cupin family protein n=1 Tax=Catenuloplanes atrovinosus TaxID=137266 RepID=A0AAE4CA46_9ACTN|nr:cupin domain-containing protein [Catenuloplanes atrovinosus]MDR7276492.1 quercetin dioxygenase-like cupin family protein [Catenuloplanes atrovinosus]
MSFSVPDLDTPRGARGGLLYVPPSEGLTKWVSGDIYTIKATRHDTNGSLALIDAVVPPGGGPIAHAHTDEDEAFFLLDGELEFLDGDRTFIGEPGSFVFIPRGRRHRFRNVGTTDVRTLFLFTPGGPEDLFVEGGDEPVPGGRPQPWDMDKVMSLADLVQRTKLQVMPEEP